MATAAIFITVLAHIIVPLALIGWLAFGKPDSRSYQISYILAVMSYLTMMTLAGAGWHWVGTFWPVILNFLFAVAFVLSIKNTLAVSWKPAKNGVRAWGGTFFLMFCASTFYGEIPEIMRAHRFDGEAMTISPPLKGGNWYIGQGGGTLATNGHFDVKAQRYALDILRVNSLGFRAAGLYPSEPSKYFAFGEEVFSPCDGEVLEVRDGLPDQTAGDMNKEEIAGNHVVLFCGGNSLLLAHLQSGSVQVKAKEKVRGGDVIGRVGNTGNTTEPHLHLHAVRGQNTGKILVFEGEPVPLLIGGKFLARTDKF